MRCHACGNEIKIEGLVMRRDECPACGADLHSCLNCTNYDPSVSNKCRDPQAEWVSDREKGNFCDYFIPNTASARGPGPQAGAGGSSRQSFDDLFKK